MDLRWCGTAVAADAAARIGLRDPRYRDKDGHWWTVTEGRWQVWRGADWHPAVPPDRIEGLASELPAPVTRTSQEEPAETGRSTIGAAVPTAVSAIGRSYLSGALSSDAAEAALSRLYAVQGDGSIWTAGVRTGRWFRFQAGHWEIAGNPPAETDVMDASAVLAEDRPASLSEALEAFVLADDPVPEAVTEPWLPVATPRDATEGWKPTHRVPASGMSAWEEPDPSAAPFGSLAGGLEVEVVERSGAWARVRRQGGAAGWVDGRLLVDA